MAKRIKSELSTATVTKTIEKVGVGIISSESHDDVIAVHKFETEPAQVGVNVGLTVNLGDFNSARIEISLRMPCYKEEIDDVFTFSQHWCEQRVEEEKKLFLEYKGSRSSSSNKSNPL